MSQIQKPKTEDKLTIQDVAASGAGNRVVYTLFTQDDTTYIHLQTPIGFMVFEQCKDEAKSTEINNYLADALEKRKKQHEQPSKARR